MNKGVLTTHVLDTAQGRPGAGLRIDLYQCNNNQRRLIKSVETNRDGRCDTPLLVATEFELGEWELLFYVGEYFANQQIQLPRPMFLNKVPIRFCMNERAHYHVPLLVSPWSYTTYRGS